MRNLTFMFLLINSTSFTQGTEKITSDQILGTWWLNTIQAEDFVNNHHGNLSSGVDTGFSLIITKDSVFFREPPLRFYNRQEPGFTYSITIDTIFNRQSLDLFVGKGKHKKRTTSYNFKLVNDELILNNSDVQDPNYTMLTQTNYYTYSKSKDENKFYEKIVGDWLYILDNDFVYSESPDTISLTKITFSDTYSYGYLVSFSRAHGETTLSYGYSYNLPEADDGVIDGVYLKFDANFTIKTDHKQLIVGSGERKTIFRILELTDNSMKLLRTTD